MPEVDPRVVAQEIFTAITHHDTARLVELTTDDVEWHSFFAVGTTGGIYAGHEGIERYIANVADAWEDVVAETEDTLVAGEVLVVIGVLHFRGRQSGVENNVSAGWMFRFRGGRVAHFRAFQDPERALQAVGP